MVIDTSAVVAVLFDEPDGLANRAEPSLRHAISVA
jgi:uncharacterized protein with PIN domain